MWARFRRGLKRVLIPAIVVVAVGGVGGFWLLHSDWFAGWVAKFVAEKIEDATGENAVVGSVHMDFEHRLLRVDGLLLTHRAPGSENDGDLILSVRSISFRPSWEAGSWNANGLEIQQPFLRLHLDDDGIREFRNRPVSERPMSSFPWDEIRVSGATVEILKGDDGLRVEGLSIEPETGTQELTVVSEALQLVRDEQVLRSEPWRLEGVQFSPEFVGFENLALEFPFGPARADLFLRFGETMQAEMGGDVNLESTHWFLPELSDLSGDVQWAVTVEGPPEQPWVNGELRAQELLLARDQDDQPHRFEELDATFELDHDVLGFELAQVDWADSFWKISGEWGVTDGSWTVDASSSAADILTVLAAARLPIQSYFDGVLALDLSMVREDDGADWEVDWAVDTEALSIYTGPVTKDTSSVILDLQAVQGEGALQWSDEQLVVRMDTVTTSAGNLGANMVMGLSGRDDFDLTLRAEDVILSNLQPLMGLDLSGQGLISGRIHGQRSSGLSFDGQLGLDAFRLEEIALADTLNGSLHSDDLKLWTLSDVQADWQDTRYGGQVSVDFARSAWLDLKILLHEAKVADLVEMVTELPGVDGDLSGTLSLEGPWNRLTGEAWFDFGPVEVVGETFEEGQMVAWMDQGQFTLDSLTLSRAEGTESLFARGSVGHGWNMTMEVIGSGFRLEYLDQLREYEFDLVGRIALDAQIGGTLMNPKPSGRVAVWDTQLAGWPIGDTVFHFEMGSERLKKQKPTMVPFQEQSEKLYFFGQVGGADLTMTGAVPMSSQGTWWLETRLDELPVQSLIPEAADGGRVGGTLDGRVVAWGRVERPEKASINALLNQVSFKWAGHTLQNEKPWKYIQREGRFHTSGLTLVGGDTELGVQANGEIGGYTRIEGGGQLDMALLLSLVDDLDQAEGDASVGIIGEGEWASMDVHLDLDLSGGRFDGSWFPAPVEGVSGLLQATSSGYEIKRVKGRMGGGEFVGDGRIDATNWSPARFELHGDFDGSRVQIVDYLPPFVANASLDFDGPVDQLLLSGQMEILDMRFNERINWEDWLIEIQDGRLEDASSEAWGDYFDLDIAIRSDETLRMRNNLADLTASGEIRIVGDTSRIGTVGDIRAIPGGRVFLNEREFEVERAELHFIDPYTYDPEVDLALVTRVNTRDERYEIDYRIIGPYSDWRTETTSDPPLPQADVHALLLFGMTRAELERYGGLGGALVAEGGDLLASRLVGKGIYQLDIVPDELRPDRIDVVSSMGSRGLAIISSEMRLLAEWDLAWDATAILEQNLARGTDTYVGLEKRLARKLYARSYWAREEYGRNVRVPGAVGVDFNIRWELD